MSSVYQETAKRPKPISGNNWKYLLIILATAVVLAAAVAIVRLSATGSGDIPTAPSAPSSVSNQTGDITPQPQPTAVLASVPSSTPTLSPTSTPLPVSTPSPATTATPTRTPTTSSSLIEISAEELYAAFQANAIAAQSQYKDKILEVTGTINGIGIDGFGGGYIQLIGDDKEKQYSGLRLYYYTGQTVQQGQTVVIKGKLLGVTFTGPLRIGLLLDQITIN